MLGIEVRPAARILLEIGDASGFALSGHLAIYARIAPVTHHSGTTMPPAPPTASSNGRSSWPRSPPCTTPPAAPTSIAAPGTA